MANTTGRYGTSKVEMLLSSGPKIWMVNLFEV